MGRRRVDGSSQILSLLCLPLFCTCCTFIPPAPRHSPAFQSPGNLTSTRFTLVPVIIPEKSETTLQELERELSETSPAFSKPDQPASSPSAHSPNNTLRPPLVGSSAPATSLLTSCSLNPPTEQPLGYPVEPVLLSQLVQSTTSYPPDSHITKLQI